ncbi:MAG: alpha/beta hydrolase, partial [Patescibacteria group bacterium]|nr:alpha/beta hydrolase [Patescibacteria group bacterium]
MMSVMRLPIVFLHGWGRTKADFDVLRRRLEAAGHHAIAFDFPGFGAAAEPPAGWSVGEYAADTSARLRGAQCSRAVIVAHSFGTRVAVVLAAEHPELVERLVLIGAPLIRSLTLKRRLFILTAKVWKLAAKLPGSSTLERWLEGQLARHPHSMDFFKVNGVMRQVLKNVVEFDLRPYLGRISAPTLLLYGARDRVTPPAIGVRAAAHIPSATLHIIKDAGHMLILEKPDAVLDEIER